MPPDPITYKKLALVRQLYHRALTSAASRQHVVDRIVSVVGFDLAVETALKAVVSSLDPKRPPSDFQNAISEADLVLSKNGLPPVPDKHQIRHIHSIRNNAQHKAMYPNESDVSDCRTYARDFLSKLSQAVWGIAFESISMAQFVQHARVRDHLIAAQSALESGDSFEAIRRAVTGLSFAMLMVTRVTVGDSLESLHRHQEFRGQDLAQNHRLWTTLQAMQGRLLNLSLGIDQMASARCEKIAGTVIFLMDGNWTPQYHGAKENPDQNDAEFVVGYAVATVLQIEERVGNIDDPYGSRGVT